MFSFKEILAVSCWILLSITSIKMQVINYEQQNINDDQQRQYEPNKPYVSYQYVRTPYTDSSNKHQFVLQHEQTNSNGDNGNGRPRVVVQHIYQNAANVQSHTENQQKYEQQFLNQQQPQQQQQPQRQQQQQQTEKYQQYYEPQKQQYFQSQTPIRQQQQQILQPQNHKQQQQYYQQQLQQQNQPTDQYAESPINFEHNYQQLNNNINKRPAAYQKYQQQKYQQQPATTNSNNNEQAISAFLPTYIDENENNTTQPCQNCCNQFEDPCKMCCSTPFLRASVLKTTVG